VSVRSSAGWTSASSRLRAKATPDQFRPFEQGAEICRSRIFEPASRAPQPTTFIRGMLLTRVKRRPWQRTAGADWPIKLFLSRYQNAMLQSRSSFCAEARRTCGRTRERAQPDLRRDWNALRTPPGWDGRAPSPTARDSPGSASTFIERVRPGMPIAMAKNQPPAVPTGQQSDARDYRVEALLRERRGSSVQLMSPCGTVESAWANT
jgi:hypothetical protein